MSMLPSRRLAAMFFCVFLLGGVAGALVAVNMSDVRFSNFLNRTSDPASLARRLDKKLATQYQLDPTEQAAIAPLTQEMAQNLYQLRRKFASDVLAAVDRAHARIAAQMTDAQRAAYARDNKVRRQRAEAMLMPAPSGGVQP